MRLYRFLRRYEVETGQRIIPTPEAVRMFVICGCVIQVVQIALYLVQDVLLGLHPWWVFDMVETSAVGVYTARWVRGKV